MRRTTPLDIDALVEALEDGTPTRRVLTRFRLTRTNLYRILRNAGHGGVRTVRQSALAQVRSAYQVARLFGVPDETIGEWLRRGWISSRRMPIGKTRIYRLNRLGRMIGARTCHHITDATLMAFLERRDCWMAWDAARIADPHWRAAALDIRARAGGHWEKATDLSRRMGYVDCVVPGWLRRGVWPVEAVRQGLAYYVWVPDTGLPPAPQPRRVTIRQYPAEKVCSVCGATFLVADGKAWLRRRTCSAACVQAARLRPRPARTTTWPQEKTCAACGATFLVTNSEDLREKRSCGAPACVGKLRGRKPKRGNA